MPGGDGCDGDGGGIFGDGRTRELNVRGEVDVRGDVGVEFGQCMRLERAEWFVIARAHTRHGADKGWRGTRRM